MTDEDLLARAGRRYGEFQSAAHLRENSRDHIIDDFIDLADMVPDLLTLAERQRTEIQENETRIKELEEENEHRKWNLDDLTAENVGRRFLPNYVERLETAFLELYISHSYEKNGGGTITEREQKAREALEAIRRQALGKAKLIIHRP